MLASRACLRSALRAPRPLARGVVGLQLHQPARHHLDEPRPGRSRALSTLIEPLAQLAATPEVVASAAEVTNSILPTPSEGMVQFLSIGPPILLQFVFLSPLPAVKKFRDEGTTGDVSIMPYSMMVANGSLWFSYGALLGNPTIMLPNVTAIVMGSAYCATFVKYRSPQASIAPHAAISGGLIAATVGATQLLPTADALNAIGWTACGVCVGMFGGPLASIRSVLRDRSAASLPLGFTLFSIANTSVWLAYGLLVLHDPFIWGPNVLGLAALAAQLGLIVRFGSGPAAGAAAGAAVAAKLK